MAITTTKSGPFYETAGTAISFSSLRTNFRATDIDGTVSNDTSPISASQLRRIDSQSNSNPTVPDATENVGISTENNLNISQFRNSVKYYKVSQTSTDTNLNISTLAWNSNLSKNIKKKVSIVGTIGSSGITTAAILTTSEQHCNLEIVVTGTGKVIGAGGTAGTAGGTAGGNGGNGGTAMNLLNTLAASVIKVTVASGANIYGGGGGGGGGTVGGTGGTGGSGTHNVTTYVPCIWAGAGKVVWTGKSYVCYPDGGAASCESGKPHNISSIAGCGGGYAIGNGCECDYCLGECFSTATVATTGGVGGPGGNGANGGVGAGYEQALGAAGSGVVAVTDWTGRIGGTNAGIGGKGGKGGDSGAGGTFGANGSPGTQGDPGIDGGDGNVTGGSDGTAGGLPVGNGGTAGRAITGSNYSVTGTINGDTVKGSI